jgi:hypothetical protein
MHLTPLEPGNRIQLPAEWVEALGLRAFVVLEKTTEGILVRPFPRQTWNEVFANKLPIGRSPPDEEEPLELTGDDLLF